MYNESKPDQKFKSRSTILQYSIGLPDTDDPLIGENSRFIFFHNANFSQRGIYSPDWLISKYWKRRRPTLREDFIALKTSHILMSITWRG